MRRARLICLLVIALSGLGAGAGADKPATQPAPDLLLEPIKRALDAGNLKEIVTLVELQAEEAMKDPSKLDGVVSVRLAAYREFARSFSRLRPKDLDAPARDTLKWLLAQKRLFPTLMMAMSESDPPERVLAVLSKLRADEKDRLEDFPDLTAAFCVVWDTPAVDDPMERMDPARMVPLFRYYSNANRMRFDLRTLPWQLAVYVVSNSISDEEIAWVQRQYQGRGAIGTVFFDVNYDLNAYFVARPKLIAAVPYTLPNLMRLGGICVDQAYYATHVARTLGVPAAVCTGQGGAGGVGHAWVGYLKVQGRNTVLWDFNEGRYVEHLYYRGNVTDPQTRRGISDSDVAMLAELQNTTPDGRLQSVALCKLVDKAPADAAYDLYVKAITLSSGNRSAWLGLADLGANKKLSVDQLNRVAGVVQKFAATRYPDFALAMVRRLTSGQPEAEQIEILEKFRSSFRTRPDILAWLRVEQGDLFKAMDKPREAMAAYMDVLNNSLWAGPIVITALDRVDILLRNAGETRRLPAIYKQVFERMPKPQPSAMIMSTPFWSVGQKYASLLRELGDVRGAQSLDSQMSGMVMGAPPR